MTERLPLWVQDWLGVIVPVSQVLLIALAAWLLQRLARLLIRRVRQSYTLPPEFFVVTKRVSGFVIYGAALVLILERLGVSSTVLWTAFTGFAAVGAVAFFAAWSVLSNIFCTMLIFTTRPFRLHDHIELVDSGDKPGLKGRVIDINVIYTTLQEVSPHDGGPGSVLQIPNNLFFQRVVRRWRDSSTPQGWLEPPATDLPKMP